MIEPIIGGACVVNRRVASQQQSTYTMAEGKEEEISGYTEEWQPYREALLYLQSVLLLKRPVEFAAIFISGNIFLWYSVDFPLIVSTITSRCSIIEPKIFGEKMGNQE